MPELAELAYAWSLEESLEVVEALRGRGENGWCWGVRGQRLGLDSRGRQGRPCGRLGPW